MSFDKVKVIDKQLKLKQSILLQRKKMANIPQRLVDVSQFIAGWRGWGDFIPPASIQFPRHRSKAQKAGLGTYGVILASVPIKLDSHTL
ncbi:MAG: hypothetical protein K8S27_05080, partial [Candidatus Omnitrophica bacterium]|nr:hypothetical protein [Candidatus Omnitrophota bacterium]